MNLDELEAKARAAKEGSGFPCDERHRLAFQAACTTDTILDLIERARAGERAVALLDDCDGYLVQTKPYDLTYDEWRESVLEDIRSLRESLAHSPQEAV